MSDIERHEMEMHAHDEEVLSTLFGPKRSAIMGGGRRMEEGVLQQVKNLQESKISVKIATSDKVIIAMIVAGIELARIWIS